MTAEGALVADRYRLGRRIGSGAMGIVWQAHDERLHRTVAIKQLLLQPGLSQAQAEEARRRCMREGRIAARLSHPNAITVYDVAEHEGDPWLIMEYLPSKSLATVLTEQGTLSPVETSRIGAQVASALVAAHAAGIVHRDIKPANILLGDDGTVKITDFGISRATGDVTVTATGMLAGTPAYLAPEVAKGEDPKPAADVFSLGSTLYTAVEGHSPFGLSENTLALLYAVAAGKISPPRQAGPLTALLMQLLRVNPDERPSLSTTRDGLLAIAEGRPAPQPLSNAAAAPTDRFAGNRLPPPPRPTTQTPPRQWPAPTNQQMSPPDGTRLDARPLAEPAPSGPMPAAGPGTRAAGAQPSARPASSTRTASSSSGRVRSIVLTVLAIVAAALVGILVASLLSSGDNTNGQGGNPSTSREAPAGQADDTSTPETETQDAATPENYENTVRDYYALLPHDVDDAWSLMTPNAQQKGGGRKAYERFWKTIESVEVLSTSVNGNEVTATLRFAKKNRTSTEEYSLTLVEQGGQILIDAFDNRGQVADPGDDEEDDGDN